jgi:hypothetical protein
MSEALTPLQALMITGLALLVLSRRKTRTWSGVALVMLASLLIVGLQLSTLPFKIWAASIVFAVAGCLALWPPKQFQRYDGFAEQYKVVDKEVWHELMRAEAAWRSGEIDDAEYSRAFDRYNVRYRALRPPPGEWREIVEERIRIREGWSRVFSNPRSSTQSQRDALSEAERRLRTRITRARSQT